MRSFDTIIVGAGVVGLTAAHELAEGGVKVAILDRGKVGSGSTGLSAGIVSNHMWHPLDPALAKLSIQMYEGLERVSDGGFRLKRIGGSIMSNDPRDSKLLEKAVHGMRLLGVRVELLSGKEFSSRFSQVNSQLVEAATYCPDDCYMDVNEFGLAMKKILQGEGVHLIEGTEVSRISVKADKTVEVETNRGIMEVENLIVACGAWSKKLLNSAGIEAPLETWLTQVMNIRLQPGWQRLPMIYHKALSIYFRPNASTGVIGAGEPHERPIEPDQCNNKADEFFIRDATEKFLKVIPSERPPQIERSWSGLYTVTPDGKPIAGAWPDVGGLYSIGGCQGLGLMLGPALSRMVAAILLNRKPPLDPYPYRTERFRSIEGG